MKGRTSRLGNTVKGLAIVGLLALPQAINYVNNGSYEVSKVGEGISERIIHEDDDKIVVTNCFHPFGTVMTDEGKDGKLDRVEIHGALRSGFNVVFDSGSVQFRARQVEYERLIGYLIKGQEANK